MAGRAQFHIATCVIGPEIGIDDKLDGSFLQLPNGGNHFIGELASAAVDYQGRLVADLVKCDVSTIADEHIKIPLNRKNVNFAVVRIRIRSAARVGAL